MGKDAVPFRDLLPYMQAEDSVWDRVQSRDFHYGGPKCIRQLYSHFLLFKSERDDLKHMMEANIDRF